MSSTGTAASRRTPGSGSGSAIGSGTSPTSQRASSLSRTTKLPGWSKVSSARPSRPWIEKRPVSAQRPSSRRQASQATISGSMLRSCRWPVIASPRVRAPCGASLDGPADRRAQGALGDVLALGEHRGGVRHDLLDGGLGCGATDSGVSPARILAWMSRGRSMLSILVSTLGTGFSGRVAGCTPRAALSRASISTANSRPAGSWGSASRSQRPSGVTPTRVRYCARRAAPGRASTSGGLGVRSGADIPRRGPLSGCGEPTSASRV